MSRSLAVLAVAALTTTFFAGPAGAVAGDVDGDGTATGDCAPLNPAIHPGAADLPDLGFVDSNCDGIDGTEAEAIFVSLGGDNAATGTRANPMRTVTAAVSAASAAGVDVYVAGGTFTEPGGVPLADGVGVYGGYTPGSGVRSLAETTTIQGLASPAAVAVGDEGVVLQQLDLEGVPDGNGNSYGLRVVNDGATPSQVLLEGVDVTAQAAGPAIHGSTGGTGTTGSGFGGGPGGLGGCGGGVLGQPGLGGGPTGTPGGNGGNTTPSLPDAATWARGTAGSGVIDSPFGPLATCMRSSIHARLMRGLRLPKKWNWIGTDGCSQKLRRPLPSPISTSNMNGSARRSLFMTTMRRWASVRSSMSTEFAMES